MQPEHDTSFEEQIRECFGRVVYTHKTHERMADQHTATLNRFKLTQIVLAGLTSTGAIGVLTTTESWIEVATVAVSFLTLFVSTYLKNFDPGAASQKHQDAAASLWNIRECYLSLLVDLPALTHEAAAGRRDELQAMLATLYTGTPRTNGKAYTEAQGRLKSMEDMTFTDNEIDCFLPNSLKRTRGRSKVEGKL